MNETVRGASENRSEGDVCREVHLSVQSSNGACRGGRKAGVKRQDGKTCTYPGSDVTPS
jgi:hypothetical protein